MPYFIKANYSSQELSPLVSVDSMRNVTGDQWTALARANASLAQNSSGYVPYDRRPETYIVPAIFALIFLLGGFATFRVSCILSLGGFTSNRLLASATIIDHAAVSLA